MPFANFKCVREVSSTDKVHCVENLLHQDYGKKWRTASGGEKTATAIFELDEPYKIIGIDIGNEHSAFVEIQVGRSSDPTHFTDILLTCSFMTPSESKSSINPNRVRCFHRDALVPTALEEKWSLVKVICTQPFNSLVPYGLSFIKIHTMEIADAEKQKPLVPHKHQQSIDSKINKETPTTTKLKLKLRENSPESESENSGSLFNRWKISRNYTATTPPTTAASIRVASTSCERDTNNEKLSSTLDRNRASLGFGDDVPANCDKLKRLEKLIEHDKNEIRVPNKHNSESNRKRGSTSPAIRADTPAKKTKTEEVVKPALPQRQYRPLNQLLKGVVLVISGIQNPDRAELRKKALAMGVAYKADWSSDCTHLICAFKNTPKYNQVKGKGKIVTRVWIEQCYKLKKYLPWRRYALDSKEQAKAESDEEIWDIALQPPLADLANIKSDKTMENDTVILYDRTDNDSRVVSSGSDTDDDIQRVIAKNSKIVDGKRSHFSNEDVFNEDTEEEDYLRSKLNGIS